jgi:uncharacterized membrane protein
MATFTTSVTVERPVGEVYEKFMDPNNMGKWISGLKSVETIEGAPETIGSKYRFRFDERGREIEMLETVTSIKRNEEYSFDMDMNELSGHVSVRFLPKGSLTEIRTRNDYNAKKLVWRMMLPFMKSQMAKRQTTDYLKLKNLIESDPD